MPQNVSEDVKKKKQNTHTLFECKILQLLWNFLEVSHKIKHTPALGTRNFTSNNLMQTYVCKRGCTQILIAHLFIIAKNWKQYKGPSPHECVKKLNS